MNIDRIKEIQQETAYPESLSVQQALLKVWNETVQEQLRIGAVIKSLPNDDKVKAHIDTLPYYGTCTTEYNEGFEDGVKWLKEQLAK